MSNIPCDGRGLRSSEPSVSEPLRAASSGGFDKPYLADATVIVSVHGGQHTNDLKPASITGQDPVTDSPAAPVGREDPDHTAKLVLERTSVDPLETHGALPCVRGWFGSFPVTWSVRVALHLPTTVPAPDRCRSASLGDQVVDGAVGCLRLQSTDRAGGVDGVGHCPAGSEHEACGMQEATLGVEVRPVPLGYVSHIEAVCHAKRQPLAVSHLQRVLERVD